MRRLLFAAALAAACGDQGRDGEVTRRIDEAGPSAQLPQAVWTGTEIGLAWTDTSIDELMFARLDARGELIAPPVQLTDAPGGTFAQAIAWNGDSYGIWFDDEREDGVTHHPYFVAVSADGDKLAPEQEMLPDGRACIYCPVEVAWSGEHYLTVFVDSIENGYRHQLRFAALDPDGSIVATRLLEPTGSVASMVWTGSELDLVLYSYVYGDPPHILVRLDDRGELLADPTVLEEFDVYLDGFTDSPSLAWTGTELAVAWGHRPIQFTRLDDGGERTGAEVRFSDFGTRPRLLWTGNEYVVVWVDQRVGGEIYIANLGADGSSFTERRVTEDRLIPESTLTSTTGGNFRMSVLWLGDQAATVSHDEPDDQLPENGNRGIYFRTFAAP